jgi:hypothetical protein
MRAIADTGRDEIVAGEIGGSARDHPIVATDLDVEASLGRFGIEQPAAGPTVADAVEMAADLALRMLGARWLRLWRWAIRLEGIRLGCIVKGVL